MTVYDAIVLGAGGMGSAALLALAERGVKVLGIEQHQVGHALGASHGATRLIRQAYFEHPDYVPLLKEVYGIWERIEREFGRRLFHKNGLVIYGPPDHVIMAGVQRASREHGIPLETMGSHAAFAVPAGMIGLLERGAGFLEVEACCIAMATLAKRAGAQLAEGECVTSWRETIDGVEVTTDRGTHRAARLVVCAGPWAAAQLPWLKERLSVHRVPLFWLKERGESLSFDQGAPCFAYCLESGFYYGVPAIDSRGVKVGRHVPGVKVAKPETVSRVVDAEDSAYITAFATQCLPHVDPTPIDHAVCMYTMTPDENFILDSRGRVHYAAGFSGHGFKFAALIGEIMADLALDGGTKRPIGFLRERW